MARAPYALLVVVLAFVVGYVLPDLVGGGSTAAEGPPTVSPAGSTPPAGQSPTAASQPTGAPAAALVTVTPLPTASPAPTATRLAATPAPSPSAAPQPMPGASPTAAARVHVVQAGDNLWDLSRQYGVSVDAIVEANHLASPEDLDLGQKLVIPPSSSSGQ